MSQDQENTEPTIGGIVRDEAVELEKSLAMQAGPGSRRGIIAGHMLKVVDKATRQQHINTLKSVRETVFKLANELQSLIEEAEGNSHEGSTT